MQIDDHLSYLCRSFGKNNYRPSHFRIKLDTYCHVELVAGSFSKKVHPVFLHEYTHFLQDISTSFGATQICRLVDEIKLFSDLARSNKYDYSKKLYQQMNNTTLTNHQLLGVRLGTPIRKYPKKFSSLRLGDFGTWSNNQNNETIEYVTFYGVDSHGSRFEDYFLFGGIAVMESMASLLERKFWNTDSQQSYPYLTVEKVVEAIYPEFGQDPANLFALCDISLMSTDPGPFLYKTLLNMREKRFVPKNPYEVFYYYLNIDDLHLRLQSADSFELQQGGLFDLYTLLASSASNQLSGYFTTQEVLEVKSYIQKIFSIAIEKRKSKPHFLLNLMTMHNKYAYRYFLYLLNIFGLPILFNNELQALSIIPRNNSDLDMTPQSLDTNPFILLAAIEELRDILNTGVNQCKLKKYCSQNPKNMVCHDCDTDPWEMLNKPLLCDFARMLERWDIRK